MSHFHRTSIRRRYEFILDQFTDPEAVPGPDVFSKFLPFLFLHRNLSIFAVSVCTASVDAEYSSRGASIMMHDVLSEKRESKFFSVQYMRIYIHISIKNFAS